MNMAFKLKMFGALILASIFIAAGMQIMFSYYIPVAHGAVTFTVPTKPAGTYQNYTFFSATTTNATSTNTTDGSGYMVIAGAKKIELYLSHGGAATSSTGTSTFNIQVSPDASTWYDYFKVVTSTSTAIQQFLSIGGATSTTVANLSTIGTDVFYAIRCIVTETGAGGSGVQGEHTCAGSAEY